MRRFTRWAFGLSAAYHGVMGALALLAPALAIVFHGGGPGDAGDSYLRALYRGIGSFMVFASLTQALVARDPDESPLLVAFGGVLAALVLGTWTLATAAGDLAWWQVSADVAIQLPVLAASVLYYPRARRHTMSVLELLLTGDVRAALRRRRLGEGAAPEVAPAAPHADRVETR